MCSDGLIVLGHRRTGVLIVLPSLTIVVVNYAFIMLINPIDLTVVIADGLLGRSLVGAIYAVDFLIMLADRLIVLILLLAKETVVLRRRQTADQGSLLEKPQWVKGRGCLNLFQVVVGLVYRDLAWSRDRIPGCA
jgi:hypothetical protein